MQEEKTLWEGHPAQIMNFGFYTFCVVFGVASLGIGFVITGPLAIWRYLSTKKTTYKLTTQRLITGQGVLSTQEDELELYRVRDTRVSKPFLIRIFGLGHVDIVTTDVSDKNVRIKGIANAKEIREQMRIHVEARRKATRTRDVEIT